MTKDLGAYVLDENSPAKHLSSSAVFYFFDKRRGTSNRPSDAIRALLAQLVHLHRQNLRAIDIVSVVLAKDETSQATATDNEVFAVLGILVEELERTFLVLDGLDKRSDYPELLDKLEEAASKSKSCALLLLSRPTIQFAPALAKSVLKYIRHTGRIRKTLGVSSAPKLRN
jgi:hypothetical protein